ncbi:hypothetical protein SPRG_10261 [Saprolegnia parasitica CBS 223.65]|uniref:Uncharacterized protein n=1 Tax=Saprolegnia parasitica (strain CBS 223.65) TaxID=695850 RepID=A0A067CD60_SAPPC|nr:hypothetical protein SPRG_10261 [Saprolegnia parasitica CBS 223.65]KDO24727.1 hypothetical protein SPRG_10261 [Saprolegnia parasitica CBS 223.65]|eukprot:XP_012204607.1 hypothetical protein SPRG_10261 [Saprolegnia parasitica CBS 223.65]
MTDLACFSGNASSVCRKADWPACGFKWLDEATLIFVASLWILLAVGMLQSDKSTSKHFAFDAAKIHDPLAQGSAVFL